MTIIEYNDKLGRVIKQLTSEKNDELIVKTAISAFTLIRQRVQETGINAKGQKFKPYSTKSMLVGNKSFKRVDVANKFFSQENLKWRTVGGSTGFSGFLSVSAGGSGTAGGGGGVHLAILEGGYKKFRELHGRKTDHVDFSFTNNMWNDITIVSNRGDHQKNIAIIGAKQDIEKKKLAGNTKRRGDILDLSEKEIDILKRAYNLGVLQIFKENGL